MRYKYKKEKYEGLHFYDGHVPFVTELDFCCDDPWEYITNHGQFPHYWDDFKTEQDAIDYYLDDRGFKQILSKIKKLEKIIACGYGHVGEINGIGFCSKCGWTQSMGVADIIRPTIKD